MQGVRGAVKYFTFRGRAWRSGVLQAAPGEREDLKQLYPLIGAHRKARKVDRGQGTTVINGGL